MPMGLRRRSRIIALQTLFEAEFAANSPDQILERNLRDKEVTGETADFAGQLVHGATSNIQALDDIIKRFAPAFPVSQLASMDRSILRLALFEILIHKEVPYKVAINEALELAKEFGSETSPRFVNGVLGAVISEVQNK
jgi:N utilization substance protein B